MAIKRSWRTLVPACIAACVNVILATHVMAAMVGLVA
jgi:hypothetical protein